MEFLTCGYKIRMVLSKKSMGLIEIAVFCELTLAWDLQKLGIILENKVIWNKVSKTWILLNLYVYLKKSTKNVFLNNKDDF